MGYIILLCPFILFIALLFILGYRISWRNFFALVAFFSAYPMYVFTGKIYSVILPVILSFILLRKDWVLRR